MSNQVISMKLPNSVSQAATGATIWIIIIKYNNLVYHCTNQPIKNIDGGKKERKNALYKHKVSLH